MSNFAALIATIQANIKTNGNEEITGAILQDVLEAMVDALGTEAINNLETALGNEETARRNADGTLQDNIDAEALRAGTAEAGLDGRLDTIEGEIPSAASSSNKLTDKAYVDAADTALDGRLDTIEGEIPSEASSSNKLADKAFVTVLTNALQTAVNGIKSNIDNGYVYAGIATPSGTPVTGKVFYLAKEAGTYTNFGDLVVTQGINILKYNGTAWSQEQLIGIDDEPTAGSNNLVKSGGVVDFYGNYVENPEFVDVKTDSEKKILEGILKNGKKLIGGGLELRGNLEMDGVKMIPIQNKEWMFVAVDDQKKVLGGFKKDGKFYADFGNLPIIQNGNILYGKRWYCAGDSFSAGAYQGSLTPETSYKFQTGRFKGLDKVYSRFIAERNNMNLELVARGGYTIGMRRTDKYYDDDNFDPLTMMSYYPYASSTSQNISNVNCSSAKNYADSEATYTFTYNNGSWLLNGSAADMTYYAISYSGTPQNGDEIKVQILESTSFYAKELPMIKGDADYITLWFGINDSAFCELGTINDNTVKTFYGALNWSLKYLIENFPFAHIGLIVTNRLTSTYDQQFQQAVRDVGQKWGVPYLDLVADVKIPTVSGERFGQDIPIDSYMYQDRWLKHFTVSPSNGHPNEFAHEYESTFIENWLRTL